MMEENKYADYYYWYYKLKNDENIWSGLFENIPIDHHSIIIAPTLSDSYTGQQEVGYAVYPNVKSILGFIVYVYLPTLTKAVIGHFNPFSIVNKNLLEVIAEQKYISPENNCRYDKIKEFYIRAKQIWQYDNQTSFIRLMDWTREFNEQWLHMDHIQFSFRIYSSPAHLAYELIKLYDEVETIATLEYELGMTKDQFFHLATNELYKSEFLKRKFVDILMNRLNLFI